MHINFYVRLFVRVYTGPGEVKESPSNPDPDPDPNPNPNPTPTPNPNPNPNLNPSPNRYPTQVKKSPSKQSYLYQCSGCEAYAMQPVARIDPGQESAP